MSKFSKTARSVCAALVSVQILSACAWFQSQDKDVPNPNPSASAGVSLPSPDNAQGLYDYAMSLEEQGKDQEAMGYYLQATQVDPEALKAHIALAQLYTKYQRVDESKIAYENVLRLDRNHPFVAQYKEARLKYYSALNIAQNDEYDKALKLLAEAPRNTPLDAEIVSMEKTWTDQLQANSSVSNTRDLMEKASLLAYQGKYQEAIELLQTASDVDSNEAVQDKIKQWQKAMKGREIVEPTANAATKVDFANPRYVNGAEVNLRQSPYLYAESLGILKQGQAVELLVEKGYEADGYHWSKIKTREGKIGWVAANLLRKSLTDTSALVATPVVRPTSEPTNMQTYGTRYIKGATVNIRRSPSLSGTLVTRATDGAPVLMLSDKSLQADGYDWSKVKLADGQIGWVATQLLRDAQQQAPVAASSSVEATAKRYAVVNATDVNVRKAPTTSAAVAMQLSKPTKVELLPEKTVQQDSYTWQHIQLSDGRTGWIVTQFLGSAQAPTVSMARHIKGEYVNVRSAAGTSASIVKMLDNGTLVTLLSTQSVMKDGYTWYQIKLSDGQTAWVASSFLTE